VARPFTRSRIDRESGMVMVGATALALLLGFAIGPPGDEVIAFSAFLMVGLGAMAFGTWAFRLWFLRGRAKSDADSIAPGFKPAVRRFVTLWAGLAGASMILFIAALVSLPTGIAPAPVFTAFFYLVAIAMLNRLIGFMLVNLAMLRTAALRNGAASD
jgi:hypothetical protein